MSAENKAPALNLVRRAAALFPPLGALLDTALALVPGEQKPLADELRELLPKEGASSEAVRELEGRVDKQDG